MIPRRPRRRGFTLIEVMVVVIIIGILASISIANLQAAQDKARVANLQSNLKTISVGLEGFSSDNGGHYPDPANVFKTDGTGLLINRYLPGDRWPKSPWSFFIQSNPLPPTPSPLISATDFVQANNTLPRVNTKPLDIIGAGSPPSSSTYSIKSYGAIVYDYSAPDTTWVLYGIGKDHTQALLSAAMSNGGN